MKVLSKDSNANVKIIVTIFYMSLGDVYLVGICFIQADIHYNYLPIFLALF